MKTTTIWRDTGGFIVHWRDHGSAPTGRDHSRGPRSERSRLAQDPRPDRRFLAQRAGISRETLRALEHGTGTVRLESLVAVLAALDLDRALVSATDPLTTEVGRARIDRLAAKRVRVRPW
ncbi:helix-turn-helix domain-containing protein [Salana multivorans]